MAVERLPVMPLEASLARRRRGPSRSEGSPSLRPVEVVWRGCRHRSRSGAPGEERGGYAQLVWHAAVELEAGERYLGCISAASPLGCTSAGCISARSRLDLGAACLACG